MAKHIHIHVGPRKVRDMEFKPGMSKKQFPSEFAYHAARYEYYSGQKAPSGTSTMTMMTKANQAQREAEAKGTKDAGLTGEERAEYNRLNREFGGTYALETAKSTIKLATVNPGRYPASKVAAAKRYVSLNNKNRKTGDVQRTKDASKLIVRNTGPDKWHVFKEGYPVAEAGPFKTAAEAAAWIKAHPQGAKDAKAKDESANAAGKLSPSLEKQIGTEGSAHREEMPANVFLEPASRKYPVKEKEGGEWKWSRKLLLAAAREARMHGDELLAKRADEIRAREFGADI